MSAPKLAVEPRNVEVVSTPPPAASLAELRARLDLSASDAAPFADALTQALSAASEYVQGPFSATGRCFTAHELRAEYPSYAYDLLLPGGAVQAGTVVTAAVATGDAPVVGTLADGARWYARLTPAAAASVTLTWTAGRGTVPPLVKEAVLQLAAHYFANPGEDARDGKAEEAARQLLARRDWAA